jgi:hypothetical protein
LLKLFRKILAVSFFPNAPAGPHAGAGAEEAVAFTALKSVDTVRFVAVEAFEVASRFAVVLTHGISGDWQL